jgi:HEAT repeat protein
VATCYGVRDLAEAVGQGPDKVRRRWQQVLAPQADAEAPLPDPVPSAGSVAAGLRAHLDEVPDDRWKLEALGACQNGEDLERVLDRQRHGGRREAHSIVVALGHMGDPRAIRFLTDTLEAMDTDPGHGFTGRREAGLAMGRIGDPVAGRVLARALETEALEHEGRPGAGLGIQFPVRSALLYAMGEVGDGTQFSQVARYLGNTSGSALGGFHLPAMDALIKLGQVWEDGAQLLVEMLTLDELPAANAVGVLGALGQWGAVEARVTDPRGPVAQAAKDALGLREAAAT